MNQDSTRTQILNGATELFAERGFHNVTIRQIVARANVNQAGVNYHFRSKDNLYIAVVNHAHAEMGTFLPNLPALLPVRQRLAMLLAFALSLGSPLQTKFPVKTPVAMKLMAWEMIQPTGLLDNSDLTMKLSPLEKMENDIVAPWLGKAMPTDDRRYVLANWVMMLVPSLHRMLPMLEARQSPLLVNEGKPLIDLMVSLIDKGLDGYQKAAKEK